MRSCLKYKFVGLLILSIHALGLKLAAQELRTLSPDDLFKIEEVGDVSLSPDGKKVAYVLRRPRASAQSYGRFFLSGDDRADVWVAPLEGGSPVNITKGESDGSGYWAPAWSPDSKRIALLSTRGTDNVRLWLWEQATGRLTKLADRGIAYSAFSWQFVWVDDRHLAAVLLPEGEQPWSMSIERRAEVATREWQKSWAGRETTADVLESGISVELSGRPRAQLVLLDLTGRTRLLAWAGMTASANGSPTKYLSVAPDRQHVAAARQVALLPPRPTQLLDHYTDRLGGWGSRYQIVIADAQGRLILADMKGASFIVPDSFQWSGDGRSYAFIGVCEAQKDGPLQVYRGDLFGSLHVLTLPKGDPNSLVWASDNRLLVSIERPALSQRASLKRMDWWLVSPGVAPRNLTEQLEAAPDELLPDATRRIFVGVADGEVWRVNLDTNEWLNLTSEFEPKIGGVVWPNYRLPDHAGFRRLVVSARQGSSTDYYQIDLLSGSVVRITCPSILAKLVAYNQDTGAALFVAEERVGTFLSIVQGSEVRPLVKTNMFLRGIAEGQRRLIEYRGLDGDDLKGWVILPPNYKDGKRYPLVTWVYAGAIYSDKLPDNFTRLNQDHPLNLQLLTARGYAVLLPSMPLKPEGQASNPYIEMTKGVLPAIDKVIELGIADSQRLAVMGQSYGGYSTYGLVTQSNRFKAAIAMAGFSDLVSHYGVFSAAWRHEPQAHEALLQESLLESGQGRMGNPPWKDSKRYLDNSPLFYVDRVQTPLLMVHGDMDTAVPMESDEEFFRAMYRQGKRARFIRYWGEGHVFTSPANIRDFWQQAYRWLDEFCDVSRDATGNLVFVGDRVRSRNAGLRLKSDDFVRFRKTSTTKSRRPG